jgi:hypothetical protein
MKEKIMLTSQARNLLGILSMNGSTASVLLWQFKLNRTNRAIIFKDPKHPM